MTTTVLRAVRNMELGLKKFADTDVANFVEMLLTMAFTLLLPVFIIAMSVSQ